MGRSLLVLSFLCVAAPAFAQLPGSPQNLSQTVSGTTVTLTWAAPAAGGAPASYLVEASFTPGGAVIASLPVNGTSLTVPNVPLGTYFVRVRAVNGSGPGTPSNEVTVSVGGSSGCPGPPTPPQFSVRATGLAVTLDWGPGPGCPSTDFTLFAGTGPGLSNVAQVNAGGGRGLQANAPPGIYFIRVVGANQYGSAVSEELTARIAPNAFTDTLQPNDAASFDIAMVQSGTYQGTLVWTDPTIDLDLYLTTRTCGFPPPTGCQLAISDAATGNTEQVARTVTAGEVLRLWVDNLSNRTTSFTIQNLSGVLVAPYTAPAESDAPRPQKIKQQ